MIVIADTGPVNYLIWIGEIAVLPKLYGRVLVPPSVCDELKRAPAPQAVRAWIAQPPSWLETRAPSHAPDVELLRVRLGPGERDAILLAQELGADELIIDDLRGRREAERRHLHFTGTLGVLRAAANEGLLDLKVAVERLRDTNFHVSEDVLDQLIKVQQPED
jgi:predicted nucleic acid-binding protein